MQVRTTKSIHDTARAAAVYIEQCAGQSVDAAGRFTLALSGGRTPWIMLEQLAQTSVPWRHCHVFQVDERVVPRGDESRNLTHIEQTLLSVVPILPSAVHAMPVEKGNLDAACAEYSATLTAICGDPPVLDLAILGLGTDGHTASLIPGDPVVDIDSAYVGLTGVYQGTRRMTLTFPVLNRARRLLWLITGAEKTTALKRLVDQDLSIPAGRVARQRATVFADESAMANGGVDLQCGTLPC